VNKYIDRQLFIELVEMISRYQPMADAAYISMGGGYLEDFRVLHQAFGIEKMLSFDMGDWMTRRQKVNRPYGFIDCVCASSTDIINGFDAYRRRVTKGESNVIIWLDYTEASMRNDQLNDLSQLTNKLTHGDVF